MLRTDFNANWTVSAAATSMLESQTLGDNAARETLTLPHDAMIHEKRTPDTKNGAETGFFPGNIYTYEKTFSVPEDWSGKRIVLEFEGVYTNARVYLNGSYAGGHPHGYSNFYIICDDFLHYGGENQVKVIANNPELTSRWYNGAGLYRDVKLLVGEPTHLAVDGLRIFAADFDEDSATMVVDTVVENIGRIRRNVTLTAELVDAAGTVVNRDVLPITAYAGQSFRNRQRMVVEEAHRWDCDTPYLYTCRVTLKEGDQVLDEDETTFGIRELKLDAKHGLRINGKETKLRGSCIHHDNGILGAATFEKAEERRCRQLKEAGFNCLRSAHHPMSKAMLRACDKLGMLVMDEVSDMWTVSKNAYDYANQFPHLWETDVENLVAKDFNHPCVILYSMGNEIPEAGTAKGAQLGRKINNKLKSLDDTRYTTNALNGMMAIEDCAQEILEDLLKGEIPQQLRNQVDSAGSNFLNAMMGLLSYGPTADKFATHPVVRQRLEEIACGMDVVGYNYLTGLHEAEANFHPNRVVVGSETFPGDIVRLWDIVERNHHVIGDMTWTGYDYLGEAGCGVFYYDGTLNFSNHWPDISADIGDIDLNGNRKPISYLREVVYGLRTAPYLAVMKMTRNGQTSSHTPWMWKDNIGSWTWPGYEGQIASVDVYAPGDEAELLLNGVSLGKKPLEGYIATFEVPYAPGILTAVTYTGGQETGRSQLETAGAVSQLLVETDCTQVAPQDIAFLTIRLGDEEGRWNCLEQKDVTVTVAGDGVLQAFGSADPQTDVSYDAATYPTYNGCVMAVVRGGSEAGEMTVTISAPDVPSVTVSIAVTK
jgi:hypothetical protein